MGVPAAEVTVETEAGSTETEVTRTRTMEIRTTGKRNMGVTETRIIAAVAIAVRQRIGLDYVIDAAPRDILLGIARPACQQGMGPRTTSGVMEVMPAVTMTRHLMVIGLAVEEMVAIAVMNEVAGGIEMDIEDPGEVTGMIGDPRQRSP